jgi:hypothetical protein
MHLPAHRPAPPESITFLDQSKTAGAPARGPADTGPVPAGPANVDESLAAKKLRRSPAFQKGKPTSAVQFRNTQAYFYLNHLSSFCLGLQIRALSDEEILKDAEIHFT